MTYELPKSYDNTTLSTAHECLRKLELRILQGWVPKVTARSLTFGFSVHEALAAWYRTSGKSVEEVAKLLLRAHQALDIKYHVEVKNDINHLREELAVMIGLAVLPELDDLHANDRRTPTLLENLIRAYCNKYRYEPFSIVAVEKNAVFMLPEVNEPYVAIIDLVVQMGDRIMVGEHKTTSSLYNYEEQYNPNSQLSGYILALKMAIENASNYALLNAIQIPKRKAGDFKDEDFQRWPTIYRSDAQLEEFVENTLTIINDIKKANEAGYFRMNTGACHQYGGCPYRQVCAASPGKEREVVLNAFYMQDKWDPLNREARDERRAIKKLTEDPV